ncbi:site-specific integrase [Saccharopolyspora sp. 6V]|nr:site-specific integrase [Saccharopolyspora sp. 6T]MCA1194614.1 site-specific integrase [Saccharopolyspora sp. 6V]MCA1279715.1 site-specific integrase [Saccharopolyspora sp. 7B]
MRNGSTSFADVRVEHVERWLAALAEAGCHDTTRARILSAVSAFYRKYLLRTRLVTHSPAALVDRRSQHLNQTQDTRSQTVLWSFEVCRAPRLATYLLAEHHRYGRRDRATIEILIGTGMRAEELLVINLDDYHRRRPRIPGRAAGTRQRRQRPPCAGPARGRRCRRLSHRPAPRADSRAA